MEPLQNVVQAYAWGSRTAIATLLDRPSPAATPEAELWMGAHPVAPSRVRRDGREETLAAWIARAPEETVGRAALAEFGPRLPFLLKVLAAETPLSLQAHPSAAQARAGFAAEEAGGVPMTAPHRKYKDPSHKPELIVALTPFDALCGFRALERTQALLATLAVPALAEVSRRIGAAASGASGGGLRDAFAWIMGLDGSARADVVAATLSACAAHAKAGGPFAAECAWAVELGALYPGDAGAVSALLLNLVRLAPGEAIYLPAGNLHAYLRGVGVEIMASSDNVLRGGLTPKHVDVAELLRVLDFSAGPIEPLRGGPGDGEHVYATPAREFRLSRLERSADGAPFVTRPWGPEILLAVEGQLEAASARGTLRLPRGASVFVPAAEGEYAVRGRGTLFRATIAPEMTRER